MQTSEFKRGLDKICDKYKIVRNIVENPFYTSFIIVLLIVIIFAFVFRDVEINGSSLLKLCIRAGVYSLVVVTGIVFIHNRRLIKEVKEGGYESELNDLFKGDVVGGTEDDVVVPTQVGGEENTILIPSIITDPEPLVMKSPSPKTHSPSPKTHSSPKEKRKSRKSKK